MYVMLGEWLEGPSREKPGVGFPPHREDFSAQPERLNIIDLLRPSPHEHLDLRGVEAGISLPSPLVHRPPTDVVVVEKLYDFDGKRIAAKVHALEEAFLNEKGIDGRIARHVSPRQEPHRDDKQRTHYHGR